MQANSVAAKHVPADPASAPTAASPRVRGEGWGEGLTAMAIPDLALAPARAQPQTAAKIAIAGLYKTFMTRTVHPAGGHPPRYWPPKFLHDRRPVGLRQDQPVAHPGRSRNRHRRRGDDHRRRSHETAQRDGVSGRVDLPVDDGVEQRRLWSEDARRAAGADP